MQVELAEARQQRLERIALRAQARTLRLWRQRMGQDFDAGWAGIEAGIVSATVAAQTAAATGATPYLAATARADGLKGEYGGPVNPTAWAGVDESGRDLSGLLFGAVTTAKTLIGRGAGLASALQGGGMYLSAMTSTAVMDAGRSANLTALTSRNYTHYVRVVQPGACSRCAILAGIQTSAHTFRRHPACFPEGVAVSGPALEGATRRWYEGELVVFTTASGEQLPLTANHPVLTRRGWVPAHLLNEGDEVFRSSGTQSAHALEVPNHDQMPTLVEDVWRSFGMNGLVRMPTTAEDFHGDGSNGEVDVVGADGTLRRRLELLCSEHVVEQAFPLGLGAPISLVGQGATEQFDLWGSPQSAGSMGSGSVGSALLLRHVLGTLERGIAVTADLCPGFDESLADHAAGNAMLFGQGVLARSADVGSNDLLGGQHGSGARWDAPSGPLGLDTAGAYASRGTDLLERLAGQVEAERIVHVERRMFSGHVYSLQSSEGWHSANNYIVSNCRCSQAPENDPESLDNRYSSPTDYFESLSPAEQDRVFTKAGAEAIRLGGDPVTVVTARRGAPGIEYSSDAANPGANSGRRMVRTVIGRQPDGTPILGYTTGEGVTKRGAYGKQSRIGGSRSNRIRLMPEEIVGLTDDMELRKVLLRDAGFINYPTTAAERGAPLGGGFAARRAELIQEDRRRADIFYRSRGINLG